MGVFDDRLCLLGEGLHWHPERKQLFWFDILGNALLSREGDTEFRWDFDEHVSACGWIDFDHLLIASESALFTFEIAAGKSRHVCALEADNPVTRSNDGRADPYGGFWIGTMGKESEQGAGAIYRYYRGELRQLYDGISISNSICFSPDGDWAYFTDTRTKLVRKIALDKHGWPDGVSEIFIDLRKDDLNPDGAIVDQDGNVWVAQWGSGRVAAYAPDGSFLISEAFPAELITCPAFGGDDLATLYATSARVDLSDDALARQPMAGAVFQRKVGFTGQEEYRVIL